MSRLSFALAVLLLSAAPSQAPLTIDFFATDGDGQPVKDLGASEVTVKAAGKDRPLTSLEFIPTREGGRNILLYVDEPTLYSLEPIVNDSVGKLIGSLKPGDRTAYVGTRRGPLLPMSDRHQSLKNAVASMVAGPGELITCLSDLAVGIKRLSAWVPRGRATTIAVLSRGAPEDPEFGTNSASGCAPRRDLLREVADAVSVSQVNLHYFTVHPTNESWGLQSLAANTNGDSSLLSWANQSALTRAVTESAGFYRGTIAADPTASERPQRLEIKTTRKKVKLRSSPTIALR